MGRKKEGLYAPLEITSTPMDQNNDEEHRIEIRDRGGSADDETPSETHDPICDVVLPSAYHDLFQKEGGTRVTHRLARIGPPAAREQSIPITLISNEL
jgi:hypothetical protein